MRAAWEWRAFAPARGAAALDEAAAELARRLGVRSPARAMDEDDRYLVLPGMRHNLKLRAGLLEAKRRVDDAGTCSLWEDKVSWTFPLADAAAVWAFTGRDDPPARRLDCVEDLVAAMHAREVRVRKRRLRLELGAARLELADVTVPGAPPLRSCCVDGYDLGAVRETVAGTAVDRGLSPMSYPELLQALWLLEPIGRAASAS